MQSVPIRRTCNMSVITFHLQICYNTNSHSISVLVCQVCRSTTASRHCMLLFVSYICYWHFHKIAISKHFKILNTYLFRFPIIMNKINMVIICNNKSTDKSEYRSLQVPWLLKVLLTQIGLNASLTKNYNFLISALYV